VIGALRGPIAGDRMAVAILVGVWAYVVVTELVKKLTYSVDSPISELLLLAVTGFAALVVIVRMPQLLDAGLGRLVIFVAPAVFLIFRDAYNGLLEVHGVSWIAIALALAAARPRIGVLSVLALLIALTAVLAIGLGVLRPDIAITGIGDTGESTRQDKALLPAIGLLAGMFPGENNLAQFLALGLPLLYLVRPQWLRLAGIGAVLLAVAWSSSRGSILTVAIVVVLMALFSVIRSQGLAVAIERLAIIGAAAVCVILPLLRLDFYAFTSRGGIWTSALDEWWQHNPFFGLGSDWFTNLTNSAVTPMLLSATHGHNQFVQTVVTGGIVLLVLTVVQLGAVAVSVRGATRDESLVTTLVLVAGLVNGWLEFVYGYVDGTFFWPVTFTVLAVIFFGRREVPFRAFAR
jgi:hypothetical protein